MKLAPDLTRLDSSKELDGSIPTLTALHDELDALTEQAWELRNSDPKKSKQIAEEIRQKSMRSDEALGPYQRGIAQSLVIFGDLSWRSNNYAEALQQGHEAEQIFLFIGQTDWLPPTYNTLGTCYGILGDHEKAIGYFVEQIGLARATGLIQMEAGAENNIAKCYFMLERHEDARDSLHRALGIFSEIEHHAGKILALANIASSFNEQGDHENAIDYIEQAHSIYEEHEASHLSPLVYGVWGAALLTAKQYDKAIVLLEKALGICRAEMLLYHLPEILLHLGKCCLEMGSITTARDYLLELDDNKEKAEYQELIVDTQKVLARVAEAEGDFEQAYQYLQQAQKYQEISIEREREQQALNLAIIHQTEMIRQEAESNRLRSELLEAEIEERKKIEEALRESRLEADNANRAKGEFLASMSHEIRTPLNGVIGMASLLQATELDAEQGDIAETIQRSGDHLLNIINEILDFSKIESSALRLEHELIDIYEIVRDVFALLKHRVDDEDLLFEYEIADEVPRYILSDRTRLSQILTNLLGNALKFTKSGYVRLTVEPSLSIQNLPQLHFVVSDSGIGIPDDKQVNLFRPFSQADASTTRKYGGTGLGLVISKRLAEHMGGKMWLKSGEGSGSSFHFTILAEPAVGPTVLQQSISLKQPASEERDTRFLANNEYSVLLVEDNVVSQKVALQMLKRLGLQADLAVDGLEAVNALAEKKYDIVLMDVHMPKLDGYQATEQIRQLCNEDEQPVIVAMTASVLDSDKQRAKSAGMDEYLTKPVKLDDIAELFDRILVTR